MASASASTHQIKSADIKPGDIIKFEYGAYNNWVTVRIDEVHIDNPNSYYPLKLIWHYLSDEKEKGTPEEAQEDSKPQRDCRAEKLGNNPAPASSEAPAPRQFTCYSNLNDLVEKIN